MSKRSAGRRTTWYVLICIGLFLLIILPILTVFQKAVMVNGRFDFSAAWNTVMDKDNIETITNSLLLGVLVVLVSTVISTPLAFLLARTRFSRWRWLDVVLTIPFMTPPYISSMG